MHVGQKQQNAEIFKNNYKKKLATSEKMMYNEQGTLVQYFITFK